MYNIIIVRKHNRSGYTVREKKPFDQRYVQMMTAREKNVRGVYNGVSYRVGHYYYLDGKKYDRTYVRYCGGMTHAYLFR